MNFPGIAVTLIAVMIVMAAPRHWAILGVFVGVCFITQWQQVDVAGFHFTAIRIVLLAAFIRLVIRGELRSLTLNQIDRALLAYAIFSAVITSLRAGMWQEQVGTLYNILLSYFVFRGLIRSVEDFEELVPRLAIFILPLAIFMFYESLTGNNIFNVFGGQGMDWVRKGRYRCIGSFRGPHTAGIFGATLMPFFVALYFTDRIRRPVAIAGFIAATLITYTSNSSGPLMAYLSCLVGLAFWWLRLNMRAVRWGIVAVLVVLNFSMKSSIWYIFSKISDITGGDGWYRSYLMDQCFRHISDWWFWGTSDTSQWGATLMDWGGADLCNVYVSCAAGSGLGSLVLYILILVLCFRNLGLAMWASRQSSNKVEILLWCIGSALFGHVVTLFSVTYWDQMHVPWWGLLGIISSVTAAVLNESEAEGLPTEEQTCFADTIETSEQVAPSAGSN